MKRTDLTGVKMGCFTEDDKKVLGNLIRDSIMTIVKWSQQREGEMETPLEKSELRTQIEQHIEKMEKLYSTIQDNMCNPPRVRKSLMPRAWWAE